MILDKIKLTDNDFKILKIQSFLISKGWQWVERIYNDGHSENCNIIFSQNKDCTYLIDNILGDCGWGRFSRISAWTQAFDTLSER